MFKCGFSVVKETEVEMTIAQLGKGRVSFPTAKELQHVLHHYPVWFNHGTAPTPPPNPYNDT